MNITVEVLAKNADFATDQKGKTSSIGRAHVSFISYTVNNAKSKKKSETSSLNLVGWPPAAKAPITEAHSARAFTGAANDCLFLRHNSYRGSAHHLLVGLGPADSVNDETLRQAAAAAYSALKAQKIVTASIDLDLVSGSKKIKSQRAVAICQGLLLSQYRFLDFKSPTDSPPIELNDVVLFTAQKADLKVLSKDVAEGTIVAENTNLSRWLGDCPGNIMNPEKLSQVAKEKAKGTKLKVTVWDKARIKKEKMGGLYGVSLGSVGGSEPKFIIMEYKGAAATKKPIVFVGKGLTFDCGGVSIKPSSGMEEMKYDMCGGATVIASMIAIAQLKLKVNVVGLVPSTENMVGPLANKPGDILRARNGKTVEVLNTDAEGRVILMDALAYASESSPKAIFDIATLTGAMVVALGSTYTGIFSKHPKLVEKVQKAANSAGEKVWHMPLDPDHLSDMRGTFADLSNMGSRREAGSSQAAAFLTEFVDDDIPHVHFDIAGTAWNVSHRLNYCQPKYASGAMLRTFVELAKLYV